MNKLKRSNHCAYETHYHIVFPVKYRKSLLYEEVTADIKNLSIAISERYEIEFEQIGCDETI